MNVVEYINGEVSDFENKYQTNGMPDKSANGLLSWCKSQGCEWGDIDDLPEVPGVLLFRSGHVGIYVGNGKGVEARGFNYGVVETEVAKRDWTTWAYLPESIIEYDTVDRPAVIQPEPEKEPVKEPELGERYLQKDCVGSDVAMLQKLLKSLGFDCGKVDGEFGTQTRRELKEFQRKYKLEVDGIYGPESHAKMMELTEEKKFIIRVIGRTVNIRTKPNVAYICESLRCVGVIRR